MRFPLACAAALLVAGLSAVPAVRACIEVEPRLVVEFAPGSAHIPPDQMIALIQMRDRARERPSPYRVAVRGYADASTNKDAKTWEAGELALADARARALSAALRLIGEQGCFTRVALGNIPDHAPPERRTEGGERRLSRGLVVFEKPDTEYAPREGLKVETDCGPDAAATPAG